MNDVNDDNYIEENNTTENDQINEVKEMLMQEINTLKTVIDEIKLKFSSTNNKLVENVTPSKSTGTKDPTKESHPSAGSSNCNTQIIKNISKVSKETVSLNVHERTDSKVVCENGNKKQTITEQTDTSRANTSTVNRIIGKGHDDVVFIKTQRKWVYTDRFRPDYTNEQLVELIINKFKTNDIIVEMQPKQDYHTKEKYNAFKIGFPSTIDDDILFDAVRWPSGICVRFFRKQQSYKYTGGRNKFTRPARKQRRHV